SDWAISAAIGELSLWWRNTHSQRSAKRLHRIREAWKGSATVPRRGRGQSVAEAQQQYTLDRRILLPIRTRGPWANRRCLQRLGDWTSAWQHEGFRLVGANQRGSAGDENPARLFNSGHVHPLQRWGRAISHLQCAPRPLSGEPRDRN